LTNAKNCLKKILSNNFSKAFNSMKWDYDLLPDSHNLGKCTNCKECEEKCTQKLPITERINSLKEIIIDYTLEKK